MPSIIDRRQFTLLLGSLAGSTWPLSATAQAYPSRPVRLIVPFAPGGPADIVGRIVSQHLGELYGQSFVVENRSGGGGIIGAEAVVRAAPDGYTLLCSSNTAFSVTPAIQRNLPIDVTRDLTVVAMVARGPQALVVRSSLGVGNLAELIAKAKREPGTLKFASSGVGAIVHMAGELFKHRAGIEIEHVPYRGGGPAVTAMLSGEVDMIVNDLSPVLEHIRAGKLKALAVASDTRVPTIPDVPTFAEAGLAGVISSSWFAIGAPSRTPADVVASLNQQIGRVVQNPAYRARLADVGLEPYALSAAEANAFIASELAKWKDLIAQAGIRIE
jgi:tripartite-type tricarboxylate transporter receptor subunit TctC